MSKEPILLDVDGVFAGFMETIVSYTNTRFGMNYKIEHMHDDFRVVLKKYHDMEMENFIHSEGFCSGLPLLSGSQEGISLLRTLGRPIIFCTSPYQDHKTWSFERTLWLKRHFGVSRDDVIFARNKRYVQGVTLVDDAPRNILEWQEYNKRPGILFLQPWNIKDAEKVQKAGNFVVETAAAAAEIIRDME